MESIADIYRISTSCHDFRMFNLKPKKEAGSQINLVNKRIYLDYASATPVIPEVLQKMLPYFTEQFGNASAIHVEGQLAKKVVSECREKVARILVVQPDQVTFTSGGTESNNLAILGSVQKFIDAGYSIQNDITIFKVFIPNQWVEFNKKIITYKLIIEL